MKNKTKTADANKLDNWLKEIDDLEGDLPRLKAIFDKKKKDADAKADEIIKKPIKGLKPDEDEEEDKEEDEKEKDVTPEPDKAPKSNKDENE